MTAIVTEADIVTGTDVDQLAAEHGLSHEQADHLLDLAFDHVVTGTVARADLVAAIRATRTPRRTTSRDVAAVLRTCSDLLGREIA